MKKALRLAVLTAILPCLLQAQSPATQAKYPKLQSGPMVGYSTPAEAALWVQTAEPAIAQFLYWPANEPGSIAYTDTAHTDAWDGYTATIRVTNLEPGTTYRYALRLRRPGENWEGSPEVFEKREDYYTFQSQPHWYRREEGQPIPAPNFSFAIGSCAYSYDNEYNPVAGGSWGDSSKFDDSIFERVAEQRPDFMIWLGDNWYYRDIDFYSRTGHLTLATFSRSRPELQRLLGSTHHYAIWDDHDYGPNNSDRSNAYKEMAQEVFEAFWANPGYGVMHQGGITTSFVWGDCEFFLLDNRYHRQPNKRRTGEATILGKAQLEWLIDALCFSEASFKFVCIGGQVLNPTERYETYANLAPEERQYILDEIKANGVEGVIFLDGDRHHTELSVLEDPDFYPIYDLTCSALTSPHHQAGNTEPNTLRLPGTLVNTTNTFAVLHLSGDLGSRVLRMVIHNTQGEVVWEREIKQSELRVAGSAAADDH